MRRFVLVRHTDVTGVSGTGVVAWGMQFPDGRVTYRWNTKHSTTCVADRIDDVVVIHGHGGATVVQWIDDEESAGRWLQEEERVRSAA